MEEPWKILLYKDLHGKTPINEFIDSLELKARLKAFNSLDLSFVRIKQNILKTNNFLCILYLAFCSNP